MRNEKITNENMKIVMRYERELKDESRGYSTPDIRKYENAVSELDLEENEYNELYRLGTIEEDKKRNPVPFR